MQYKKYTHIERMGTGSTDGIEIGECLIFPKIDGTCSSLFIGDDGEIKAGSRNRLLTLENDNQGFYAYALTLPNIKKFFKKNSGLTLYSEFLCLSGDTVIKKTCGGRSTSGNYMTIRDMYCYFNTCKKEKIGKYEYLRQPWWRRYGLPKIFSLFEDKDRVYPNRIKDIFFNGVKVVYELKTRRGFTIKATVNHPFFTNYGWKELDSLDVNDVVAICELKHNVLSHRSLGIGCHKILQRQKEFRKNKSCVTCGATEYAEIHHIDGDWKNNNEDNWQILCRKCHNHVSKKVKPLGFSKGYKYEFDKIISIKEVGEEDVYDIQMENEMGRSDNFVADNFIVHNCPHSLKTYRDDAWRKFYVFDVMDESGKYLHYDVYKPMLEEFGIEYIPPIRIIKNGSIEVFTRVLEENKYLIKDGEGTGEGIVIKNVSFINKFGRYCYGKIVTSEFKEKHIKEMGAPVVSVISVESQIVDKYVTEAFIRKEHAKIINNNGGWESRMIPQFLSTVFHELILEETWNFIKHFKNPRVDFKLLSRLVTAKVKETMKELF